MEENSQASDENKKLYETVDIFIEWKDKLKTEVHDGQLMFSVPKHHKLLNERELFTYYMDIGRYINK